MRKSIFAAFALAPLFVCDFAAAQTAPPSAPVVIVNNQRLSARDVRMLEQTYRVRVLPGRYWMNAIGTFGYEGVPFPLGNIWQLANAASSRGTVRKEGILSSYDKTGLAVFGY